jgi:LPP20 lipoprotein
MKKSLILILITIFTSCSSSSSRIETVSNLPAWYSSPKQNDAINLYGIGEGYSMDEAVKSGLKSLASKLMISISSESSTLLEENKFYANEESRQKINEVVEKMTFASYVISKSAQNGPRIYIEISVDRKVFIEERTQKLSELNKRMKDIYDGLSDKNILEKYNKLSEIIGLTNEARSIHSILSGLGAGSPDQKSDLERYGFYQKTYDGILNQIEFFIELNNSPKSIANVFGKAISKEKIKIAKVKSSSSNLVIIDIKSDLVANNIYETNIAKLKVNISLLSSNNKVLGSNSIEVTGNSVVSKEEAINAATSRLAEKIDQDGILKTLSIK